MILGERTLFVAVGSVDAGVDLQALGPDAAEVSEDGSGVSITLPPAEVYDAQLDSSRSYVFERDEGLLNRIGNVFSGDGDHYRDVTIAAEERLDEAVTLRLVADVPLGAFLSGGIDSGAVTSPAGMAASHPLATFPIGFPAAADERPDAALVAARYGTRHVAEDGMAANYLAMAREIPRLFGEPFGDHSAVPNLAVASLARRWRRRFGQAILAPLKQTAGSSS